MTKYAIFLTAFLGFILLDGCTKTDPLTQDELNLSKAHGSLLYNYNKFKLHGISTDSVYFFKRDSILNNFGFTKEIYESKIKDLEKKSDKWKKFITSSLENYDNISR
ncbi:MAG: hypothetical protein O3A55_03630 [Bacteroidetes bacterium]|nr:hypothetical protein [Bacteroidota bacterium]